MSTGRPDSGDKATTRGADGAGGAGEALDYSKVPMYPMVRAVIRHTEDGELEGVVDDVVVATSTELEPVRAQVVAAAAREAARRKGPFQAIRVRGTAPNGSTFQLIVTAAGEVVDTTSTTAATGRAGRGSRSGSAQSNRPGVAGGAAQTQRRGVPWLLVLICLVPVVPLVGLVALFVTGGGGDDGRPAAVTTPSPTQLPVVAPAPYGAVAPWSVDLGRSSFAASGASVAADAERVFVAGDAGRKVQAYDAATGVRRWSVEEILEDPISSGPALAAVEGRQVLVVASSRELATLDPATGERVGIWDLPGTFQGVVITPSGPVVRTDATHAEILAGGDLVSRVIPATGVPVAPTQGGALLVVGALGELWLSSSDTVAGDPVQAPRVEGAVFAGVAGWTGSQLVLTYRDAPTDDTDEPSESGLPGAGFSTMVRLVGLDADLDRSWVTSPIPDAPGAEGAGRRPGPLWPALGGSWGIFGTTTVDLATGETVVLSSDWRTTAVGDDVAFGTGEGRPLAATVAGVTRLSANSPSVPASATVVAPQAVSGTRGYLLSTDGAGEQVLFAIALEDRNSSDQQLEERSAD